MGTLVRRNPGANLRNAQRWALRGGWGAARGLAVRIPGQTFPARAPQGPVAPRHVAELLG
ncbi:hypothetical protein MC885_000772 [Smutsia gigantea]|nr:hypothetical protein MC885_000772 [Smutsia gigantea]